MNDNGQMNFLYLNCENRWRDFHRYGLEVSADGTVKLSSLPLLDDELSAGVADLPPLTGPAGIAIGPEGTVYFSDPAGNAGTPVSATTDSSSVRFDKTAPVVTLTSVNGSAVTFPYSTNQNVTSVGGACGTASGDMATVNVTLNGSPATPATA